MPLTPSSKYRPDAAPELTEDEKRRIEKEKRQFTAALEDMADEQDAVMITVLKDLGKKSFEGNDPVQGFLVRWVTLTGEHEGLVREELPTYKAGFTNRIRQAGVGATMVARVGRYQTKSGRKALGLEDEQDGDVTLAEKALAKHGDPFEDQTPSENRGSLSDGVSETKANAAAKAKAEAGMDEPPF